jgi:hypothetical protein
LHVNPRADETVTFYGLTFPPEIAGAARISVRDYESENPGLGYSVGYRRGATVSTVYIYDTGRPSIPDRAQAQLVAAELQAAKEEIAAVQKQGGYTKVEPREDFTIADRQRRVRLSCAGFLVVRANQPGEQDSFVCVGAANNKFLKFRITTPRDPGLRAQAQKFLGAWIDRLWPSS